MDPRVAPGDPQFAALTQFALQLVREAGPIALRYFRQPAAVFNKAAKGGFDPVTEADRGIESMLRARIEAAYPTHGIAGEEHGAKPGTADFTWYIDPIDGTRSYMSGMPAWGILLGLKHRDACVLGIVHQPFLDETFVGAAIATGGLSVLAEGLLSRANHAPPCELALTAPAAAAASDAEKPAGPAAPVKKLLNGVKGILGR